MKAEAQIQIMQAYLDGSPIEMKYTDEAGEPSGEWMLLSRRSGHTHDHAFDFHDRVYRVVPKRKVVAVLWDNHYDRPASLQPNIDEALEEADRLNKKIAAEHGKPSKRYTAVVMSDGSPE